MTWGSEEWNLMKKKSQRGRTPKNESLHGSYGFANEIGGKQAAAKDFLKSSFGHGHFQAGPIDDCENPRLPSKRIEFGGKRRREVSRVRRHDVADDTRGIPDRERARRRRL